MNNTVRDSRNAEITDDADDHEYDINHLGSIAIEPRKRIRKQLYILLRYQTLNFGQHASEQVAHRKP